MFSSNELLNYFVNVYQCSMQKLLHYYTYFLLREIFGMKYIPGSTIVRDANFEEANGKEQFLKGH